MISLQANSPRDQPGQDFGFPCYGGTVRTVEYKDDPIPAGVVPPQVETAPHAADLGMMFCTGKDVPPDVIRLRTQTPSLARRKPLSGLGSLLRVEGYERRRL